MNKHTFFKDLLKREKKHLAEAGITTLGDFKRMAELQARESMLKREIASASRRGMITVVGVRPIEQ